MHIIERTQIDRPAVKVWPFIVTPEYFRQWNDKVISMAVRDRFVLGQQFATHYRMKGKAMQCLSTVTAMEEGRLLEIRHSKCVGSKISQELTVCERITLTESNGRTVVSKDVDVRNHGIPWIFIPIVWFVNRSGKPVGPDKLKALCEANP